ncbi:hypothetical protein V8J88_14680 [Massilia sp. W12]
MEQIQHWFALLLPALAATEMQAQGAHNSCADLLARQEWQFDHNLR